MWAWLGKTIVAEFVGRLIGFVSRGVKAVLEKIKIKKQAEASVEPLKNAKTAEEIDAATDDALDNL